MDPTMETKAHQSQACDGPATQRRRMASDKTTATLSTRKALIGSVLLLLFMMAATLLDISNDLAKLGQRERGTIRVAFKRGRTMAEDRKLLETIIEDMEPMATVLKDEITTDVGKTHENVVKEQINRGEDDSNTFLPGTLKGMSRLEVLSRCYVDPNGSYKRHFRRYLQVCSLSQIHRTVLWLLPKSASSTIRSHMRRLFNATDYRASPSKETPCWRNKQENGSEWLHLSVVRDPIQRFFSGFDEMLRRRFGDVENFPDEYSSFLRTFRSLSLKDFYYLNRKPTKKWKFQMASALERFVIEYDGVLPFDPHLVLQSTLLMDPNTGRMLDLDYLGETCDLQTTFDLIATKANMTTKEEIVSLRVNKRYFDAKDISKKVWQKVCALVAIDLCCLNYELPLECRENYNKIPDYYKVTCRWDEQGRIVPQVSVPQAVY